MRENLSIYHPVISFLFFVAVIILSVIVMNPMFIGISLICALIYAGYLKGVPAVKFGSGLSVSLIILSVLFNALLNHRGATPLFYLPGNWGAVTFESIMYGFTTGLMIGSVIVWFISFNVIISSDKLTFLFGRLLPAGSLIFIMVLRFIPRYKEQIIKIGEAQQTIGMGVNTGTFKTKINNGARILSIMFTWALENAIQTADSMKSRGYGLKNRTSFMAYRFTSSDKILLSVVGILVTSVIIVFSSGFISSEFYPYFELHGKLVGSPLSFWVIIYGHLCFAVLSLIPIWLGLKEYIYWRNTNNTEIDDTSGIKDMIQAQNRGVTL